MEFDKGKVIEEYVDYGINSFNKYSIKFKSSKTNAVRYYPVKLDSIFKHVFKDTEVLSLFLSDILDKDIKCYNFEDTEITPDEVDGKKAILDIFVRDSDGIRYNVEIQQVKDNDYPPRAYYYWSKAYTKYLKSGDPYAKLSPSVGINILGYNMFTDSNEYMEVIKACRQNKEVWNDILTLVFLELEKVKPYPKDKKGQWLRFINTTDEEELKMLTEVNKGIYKANEKRLEIFDTVSLFTDAERDRLDKMKFEGAIKTAREDERLKTLKEKEAEIKAAKEDGIEKGIEKGREQAIEEFRKEKEADNKIRIKKMVRGALPEAEIIEYSNLPEKEVKRLIKIVEAELAEEAKKTSSGMSHLNMF